MNQFRPPQEMQAEIDALRKAMLDYLSEYDNPVPDVMHRRTLRDHMRKVSGAPAESARRRIDAVR